MLTCVKRFCLVETFKRMTIFIRRCGCLPPKPAGVFIPEAVLAEALGPVVTPAHLHYHSGKSLVCDTRIDRAGAEIVWKSWLELTGTAVRCRRGTVYDHSYLAFETEKMGVGMVVAPRIFDRDPT